MKYFKVQLLAVFVGYCSQPQWSNGYLPRFVGSNSDKDNEFLRAIKIHSTTSFKGEVKLSVPCHIISQHFTDILSAIFAISQQVSPDSLLGVCADIFHRALVDDQE
jgi:hypothetical protein